MHTQNRKGKIFVIDGLDGSGKATQARRLVERLKKEGKQVETIDFPRYKDNFMGKLIRECLDGKEGDFLAVSPRIVSVLYARDRHESSPLIQKWLAEGKIVVIDRYVSSNQIHQGGKIRDDAKRKEFLTWLDQLEHESFGIPRPDAIVYLHVPVEVSMKLARDRALKKGEAPDKAEVDTKHQLESQESALSIIKSANNWFRIDCGNGVGGMRPEDVIHEEVFQAIQSVM
jgi:dTMP kinase